ncbi:MAG TPA: YdeI/OmpD-associated family protein [Thermoanaerobaculia bacterium]|nr:YdeI/OmpD-associated family protein [Thermoanaerobaculia bacterium]
MNVKHFASQAAFRKWLEKNHDQVPELYVGFYNQKSGRGGLTYKEAVDESLCFGWIDGVRKNVDEESYTNRFTPRKAKSYWSAINTKRYQELDALGLVAPPGRSAFEARDATKTAQYSFERESADLEPAMRKKLEANKKAAAYFDAQPPYYRRLASWFVIGAKKEETREKRLALLIEVSAKGERLPGFVPAKKK